MKQKATPIFIAFLVVFSGLAQSQTTCPPASRSGVHVVQAGENLYRISLKYGLTVDQLCQMNNILPTDKLSLCRELVVKLPESGAPTTTQPPVAQPTTTTPATTEYVKPFDQYVKQKDGVHYVQYGETVENLARLYGYTTERFREFNGLLAFQKVAPGQVLRSTDCVYPAALATTQPATTTPPSTTQPVTTQPTTTPVTTTQPTTQPVTTAPTTIPSASFLTTEEMQMVDEINLVRTNPAAYAKFVAAYIEDLKKNGDFGNSVATATELIDELKKTPTLPALQATECIYRAAKKHGDDLKRKGYTDHQGSDGLWPWDRILRECPTYKDGNENLVGGPESVREAVIILLVDDGVPNRGHRKTLLNSRWKYVACHKMGTVGDMPNCWVQKFAY